MKIYLAIDIKDGKCVRLRQGNMQTSKIFNDSPLEQAKIFEKAGFKDLHIVDLDGALHLSSQNSDLIGQILKNTSFSVQLGGGIRTMEQIDFWISQGVKRVIIGTKAVKDITFLENACKSFPSKISLAIDAKDGIVATNAWQDLSEVRALDLIKQVENFALYSIIYTDIKKDGMLQGPNFEVIAEVAQSTHHTIIASGGVSCFEDILKLQQIKGVGGVILGTAIYEGLVKLENLASLVS